MPQLAHAQLAYLTIIPRGRMTSYRLSDAAGRLLWATRATARLRGSRAHGSAYVAG